MICWAEGELRLRTRSSVGSPSWMVLSTLPGSNSASPRSGTAPAASPLKVQAARPTIAPVSAMLPASRRRPPVSCGAARL